MWTADLWVYILDDTLTYAVLNNDDDHNGCFGFQILDGQYAAYIRGNSGQSITGPFVNSGTWEHVRVTHTGSGYMKYYVNGTAFGTNRCTYTSNMLQTGIVSTSLIWGTGNID